MQPNGTGDDRAAERVTPVPAGGGGVFGGGGKVLKVGK